MGNNVGVSRQLRCCVWCQNGAKVVCGSEEGVLDIFNWGEWGNISDRFPGHPMSVDAIVPLTDSLVCTGASDGVIRCSMSVTSGDDSTGGWQTCSS